MGADIKTDGEISEHREETLGTTGDVVEKAIMIDTDVRLRQKKSKDEKSLVRKTDLLILPLLSGSIFFAYLDRSQIGNARVMGMQADIGMTNQQYFNCLMIFFTGYMLVELAAGMLLRICPPRFMIGGACLCFGVFASCMAAVKSYGSLMGLRVLLGLSEGIGYNVYLYSSLWYKPSEMAQRTAAIYGMSPIAGATSGLIAYGVGKNLNGAQGFHAWQWLFIIEGTITIAFSLLIIVFLPGLPDTVASKGHFLFKHEEERRIISLRTRAAQNTEGSRIRYHQILIGLKDPKLYLSSLMLGAWGMCVGGFTVFLPTFINEFGFSTLDTQLYSMIPYSFGFAALIVVSILSDHLNHKAWIVFGCLCVTMGGFVILLATTNRVALIAGLCFVLIGLYPGVVVAIAWIITLHGGFTKRALAIWVSQIFIQSYSIIATEVYNTPPHFYKGHGIGLGLCVLSLLSIVALYYIMARANAERDRRARDFEARGEVDPLMEKDFEDLCDFHPAWRYPL